MNDRVLLALIVAGLVVIAILIGAWLYALYNVSVNTLRLWATLATLAAIGLPIAAFWLGVREAQARIKGLEEGITKVAKAAAETVSAAEKVAQVKGEVARKSQSPAVQQVILPGVPLSGLIASPRREGEEVELP